MRLNTCIAALAIACAPVVASASVLYSDTFDTAADASNYNVYSTNGSNGNPASDAVFGYNYNAVLGIPAAPHTTDGSTTGLRVRADSLQASSGSVVGAISVATKNLTLPSQYVVSVDIWSNYVGGNSTGTGLASSGSNGSTGVTVGLGSSGSSIQYVAANDGFMVEAFGDGGGGSGTDYRTYTNNTHPVPTNSTYFAAGTGSSSATHTDSYYSFLTSNTAPSAQTTLSATQQGNTPVGVIGFAWHTFTITQDGTDFTWAIDGHTIATVPDSAVTLGGDQISLGNSDSGLTGNYADPTATLNAQIFDNLTVSSVPEPASLSLLAVGAAGLFGRRRRGR